MDRETPPAKKRGRYRPVRCRETGIVYPSVVAAAQSFGNGTKNYGSIRLSAKSGGTAYGYHWEFEDEQAPKMKPFGRSKPVRCVETDERFRPTVKTEWPHASAVNGIYPEDVADLPTIETAIPRLREIFAGADEIIGYNVGFDLGFLSAVGVRPREDARITDTMNEFTWFMGRRYKLVDAADHIGYEWTGRAHGSLADALATLAVQRWLEQWLVAE